MVKPEYNHSTSPALLNALEHAYHEWHDKAVAFAGYDTAGRVPVSTPTTPAPTVPKPQRRPPIRRQCDAAAPTSPATTAAADTAAPTSATTAAFSATTAAAAAAAEDDRGSGCGCSGSPGGLQLDLIMINRTLFGGDEPAHLTVTNRSQGRWPERWSSANADTAIRTWARRLYTDPPALAPNRSRWTPGNGCSPATAQKF